MDKIEFDTKVREFIRGLYSVDKFQYLEIAYESTFTRTLVKPELQFKSNADITISNSPAALLEIRQFIERLVEQEKIKSSIKVKILFKALLTSMNKSKNKEKSEQERFDAVQVTEPKYSMDEVVLPTKTLNDINNAIAALKYSDLINNQWGWKEKSKSVKTILCFYGAPGTGKTICAHAIAKQLGKKILIASYADIQSMYVGEGPKNLKAVFEKAEQSDALLFFDEADSFLRKRTSDSSSSSSMHYNSMTNEMMKHLEEFNGIIIFATNLTDNTDEAFKTRITASIEFLVPDQINRKEIIKKLIPPQIPTICPFSDNDYLSIAKMCEGFVGRDIRNAIYLTLCDGAEHKKYPFSVDDFISCFTSYKEGKDGFNGKDKTNDNKSVANQVSLMGINGSVISLLTYIAWYDGEETEEETELLKDFAKVLGRAKPLINKLSDLPSVLEMCQEIRTTEAVPYTLKYMCEVLADSSSNQTIEVILNTVVDKLLDSNALEIKRWMKDYINKLKELKNQKTELKKLLSSRSVTNP